jgi:hypothetical protein
MRVQMQRDICGAYLSFEEIAGFLFSMPWLVSVETIDTNPETRGVDGFRRLWQDV